MATQKEYLFRVRGVRASIRTHYRGSLGWFFDDGYDNPLSFPLGILDITADDRTKEILVVFDPKKIGLKKIQSYLSDLGIKATPLRERVPSLTEQIMKIVLYPFVFLFVHFGVLCWKGYKIIKGRK